MYSSTLSLTSALDGDGLSTPHPCRFTPGKDPVPVVQEAGLAPGSVWTGAGFDPRTVHPVASRYIDCAIPAHLRTDRLHKISFFFKMMNEVMK